MLRLLVLLHRYLGIALCLLFAMWFASGTVMVFVPYPELQSAERYAGMQPLDVSHCCVDLATAFTRSGLLDAPQQVRLTMVGARPAFHFHPSNGKVISVYADTGDPIGQVGHQLALDVANRFMSGRQPVHAALEEYDQWSVPNQWDPFRPFHRIAMNDAAGTELYISAQSGEVMRDTTRIERGWNWVGSVLHWIYPTLLRKHPSLWDSVVWWLSLAGTVGAISGVVLGIWRFRFKRKDPAKRSPFRGWMYWHHLLGLGCMVFILTWIVSGWLSMDHGRLFSDGSPTQAQRDQFSGGPLRLEAVKRNAASAAALPHALGDRAKEVELVQLGGTPLYVVRYDHRRSLITQSLSNADFNWPRMDAKTIAAAAAGLLGHYRLTAAQTLEAYDSYYYRTDNSAPLPVIRLRFDDPEQTWFHVDPSSVTLMDRMDASRRAYRWWFDALHTLDIPFFQHRVALWRGVVVLLCAFGFAFSCTGAVIAWRRLFA